MANKTKADDKGKKKGNSKIPDKSLFQDFEEKDIPVQRVVSVKEGAANGSEVGINLLVTVEEKINYDLYRIKARMSLKALIVAALEEYIANHPV